MLFKTLRSPYFWFGLLLSYNLYDWTQNHGRYKTHQQVSCTAAADRSTLTEYPGP